MIRNHACCHYSTDPAGNITAGQGAPDANGIWSIPCAKCAAEADAWFAQETVIRKKPRQIVPAKET